MIIRALALSVLFVPVTAVMAQPAWNDSWKAPQIEPAEPGDPLPNPALPQWRPVQQNVYSQPGYSQVGGLQEYSQDMANQAQSMNYGQLSMPQGFMAMPPAAEPGNGAAAVLPRPQAYGYQPDGNDAPLRAMLADEQQPAGN